MEGALLGNNGEVLTNDPVEEGEVDIYRDTALRYAGMLMKWGALMPINPRLVRALLLRRCYYLRHRGHY